MLNKVDELFENPGSGVKKIARFCFFILLLIAIVLFLWGAVRLMSAVDKYSPFNEVINYTVEDYAYGLAKGYDWYVDGYLGKMQCKAAFFVFLVSFSCIPLYAFGELVEEVKALSSNILEIKTSLQQKQNDTQSA